MSIEERMAAMAGLDDDRQVADLVAAAHLLDIEPVGDPRVLHGRHVHDEGRGHRPLRSRGARSTE